MRLGFLARLKRRVGPTRAGRSLIERKRWLAARLERWRGGVPVLEWRLGFRRATGLRRSTRPLIRWVKGNGLDDEITRSAIAQATRLFGSEVDYCICTVDISAARLKEITAWAVQPVEWLPVTPRDNPRLSAKLRAAGCRRDAFGYWWKWFPDRVRPNGPEWILDGDMVIVDRPAWFEDWKIGKDPIRVSQSNDAPLEHYGEYADLADHTLMLYSGLVSLPPGADYMDEVIDILTRQPLVPGHNGCTNMSEQGVIAAAFSNLRALPIPLYEFPFAISGLDTLVYGVEGHIGPIWGFHFGSSFREKNELFEQLVREGRIYWQPASG